MRSTYVHGFAEEVRLAVAVQPRCVWCCVPQGMLHRYVQLLGTRNATLPDPDVRQRGACGGTYVRLPPASVQGKRRALL